MGTINIQNTKSIDQVNTQERVTRLFSRSIKKDSKMQALFLALSMIDLTTLEGKDSEAGKVSEVIQDGYTIGERLLRPSMVGVFKSKKS